LSLLEVAAVVPVQRRLIMVAVAVPVDLERLLAFQYRLEWLTRLLSVLVEQLTQVAVIVFLVLLRLRVAVLVAV
jgi:hypothetical protein